MRISFVICLSFRRSVWQQGSGNGTGGVHVEVKKADGAKCERCWNYSTHVGEDKNYPTVCERCSAVLKELEAQPRLR